MKPRALRLYKALYGKDHESYKPPEKKVVNIEKEIESLAAQFAEAGITARDLAHSFSRLADRQAFNAMLENAREMVTSISMAEVIAEHERDTRQAMPIRTHRQYIEGLSHIYELTVRGGGGGVFEPGDEVIVSADYSGIEERIIAMQREAGGALAVDPSELRTTWIDDSYQEARPRRYQNPDANIRGFRRGR